jgi:hypothetical protein
MRKSDWLDVGLKILGAYFLIVGVREILQAFVALVVADSRGVRDLGLGWFALLFPLVEVAAGLILILISWRVAEPPGLVKIAQAPENLVDFPADDGPAGKSERPEEPFWEKKP